MSTVVCFGDLLIDFVPSVSGSDLADVPSFERAAGGAAANVAVGLRRLGTSSAFIGKVGDDPFGHFLADTLSEEGVDIAGIRFEPRARTALAFVSLRADGEREFLFYRHPSADMLFTPDEVDRTLLEQARIFHFDSISLAAEQPRETALFAADEARRRGALVSYDVNLRLPLWKDEATARTHVIEGLGRAALVKMSDDELEFLTGAREPQGLFATLWHDRLVAVVITLGRRGCILATKDGIRTIESIAVKAVDTTGAGDGFVAGLLDGLSAAPEDLHDVDALMRYCRFASAVGALTTTARGAIPALPRRQQVETLLEAASP